MIDPLEKAAECDRAIELCSDPDRMVLLTSLRGMWIVIGNMKARERYDWQDHALDLEKVHADILKSP